MKFVFKLLILFIAASLSADEKPNILFIIADDLGARLGCYDDSLSYTPTLDKLATEGVLFKNCYTQFPTCGPSRMSMLTGLYPQETGVLKNQKKFQSPVKTLPHLFRENGYNTARVGKVFHMGIPRGIGEAGADDPQAWSHSVNNSGWDSFKDNISQSTKYGTYGNPGVAISYSAPDIQNNEMADGVGTERALNLLKTLNPEKTGKPFILFMGYYRPHPPMIAPKSSWDKIDPTKIILPKTAKSKRTDIPDVNFHLLTKDFNYIPDELGKKYTHAYYAAINFIDTEVKKLLEGLKQNNLSENTIVVFTSDQGFHLGEQGHWHKSTFFEQACKVPLIIVDPRSNSKDEKMSNICGLIDLYPTLCDLSGLQPDHKPSGKSLSPLINGEDFTPKEFEITQGKPGGISIRTRRYRYTKWMEHKGAMLFDLEKDPMETKNLINNKEYDSIYKELDKMLNKWLKSRL